LNGADKTKLRSQVWWKELRRKKIEQVKARDKEGKLRCELTGVWIKKDSSAQCHHRFPDKYESMDLDDYRILSASSHDFIEWLATINPATFPNRDKMLQWLADFLPAKVRQTEKLYQMIQDSVARNKEVL